MNIEDVFVVLFLAVLALGLLATLITAAVAGFLAARSLEMARKIRRGEFQKEMGQLLRDTRKEIMRD